ncbi:MAG: LysR family transcriptional regulator substrate-binding protein [Lachnospiraceae bacterium]
MLPDAGTGGNTESGHFRQYELYEIDKLNSYEMLSDQIVFCVSPGASLASYKEATMEMLKDEPLIMYNTDSVLNTTLQARFDSLRIKPKVLLQCQPALHNT